MILRPFPGANPRLFTKRRVPLVNVKPNQGIRETEIKSNDL